MMHIVRRQSSAVEIVRAWDVFVGAVIAYYDEGTWMQCSIRRFSVTLYFLCTPFCLAFDGLLHLLHMTFTSFIPPTVTQLFFSSL